MSGIVIDVEAKVDKAQRDLENLNSTVGSISKSVASVTSGFSKIAGALSVGGTLVALTQIDSTFTSIENNIRLVTGATKEFGAAYIEVQKIANETRSTFESTAQIFAKLGIASSSLNASSESISKAAKSLQMAGMVAGGSTEGFKAAMMQLGQALGSGVLRGEEFNSIMEQALPVAQMIADSLNVSVGALRDMANQGRITSEVVFNALLTQSTAIEKKFKLTGATLGSGIDKARESFSILFNEISKSFGISSGLGNLFLKAGNSASALADDIKLMSLNMEIFWREWSPRLSNAFYPFIFAFNKAIILVKTLLAASGIEKFLINMWYEMEHAATNTIRRVFINLENTGKILKTFDKGNLFTGTINSIKLFPKIFGSMLNMTISEYEDWGNKFIKKSATKFYVIGQTFSNGGQYLMGMLAKSIASYGLDLSGLIPGFTSLKDLIIDRTLKPIIKMFKTLGNNLVFSEFDFITKPLTLLGTTLRKLLGQDLVEMVVAVSDKFGTFNTVLAKIVAAIFPPLRGLWALIELIGDTGSVINISLNANLFNAGYNFISSRLKLLYKTIKDFATNTDLFKTYGEKVTSKLRESFKVEGISIWYKSIFDGLKTQIVRDLKALNTEIENISGKLGFKINISTSLKSAAAVIRNFSETVIEYFRLIWDKVVGHSYWTDTISEINSSSEKLSSGPLGKIISFARNVISTFKSLYSSIKQFISELKTSTVVIDVDKYKSTFDDVKKFLLELKEKAIAFGDTIVKVWENLKDPKYLNSDEFKTKIKSAFSEIKTWINEAQASVNIVIESEGFKTVISEIKSLGSMLSDTIEKSVGKSAPQFADAFLTTFMAILAQKFVPDGPIGSFIKNTLWLTAVHAWASIEKLWADLPSASIGVKLGHVVGSIVGGAIGYLFAELPNILKQLFGFLGGFGQGLLEGLFPIGGFVQGIFKLLEGMGLNTAFGLIGTWLFGSKVLSLFGMLGLFTEKIAALSALTAGVGRFFSGAMGSSASTWAASPLAFISRALFGPGRRTMMLGMTALALDMLGAFDVVFKDSPLTHTIFQVITGGFAIYGKEVFSYIKKGVLFPMINELAIAIAPYSVKLATLLFSLVIPPLNPGAPFLEKMFSKSLVFIEELMSNLGILLLFIKDIAMAFVRVFDFAKFMRVGAILSVTAALGYLIANLKELNKLPEVKVDVAQAELPKKDMYSQLVANMQENQNLSKTVFNPNTATAAADTTMTDTTYFQSRMDKIKEGWQSLKDKWNEGVDNFIENVVRKKNPNLSESDLPFMGPKLISTGLESTTKSLTKIVEDRKAEFEKFSIAAQAGDFNKPFVPEKTSLIKEVTSTGAYKYKLETQKAIDPTVSALTDSTQALVKEMGPLTILLDNLSGAVKGDISYFDAFTNSITGLWKGFRQLRRDIGAPFVELAKALSTFGNTAIIVGMLGAVLTMMKIAVHFANKLAASLGIEAINFQILRFIKNALLFRMAIVGAAGLLIVWATAIGLAIAAFVDFSDYMSSGLSQIQAKIQNYAQEIGDAVVASGISLSILSAIGWDVVYNIATAIGSALLFLLKTFGKGIWETIKLSFSLLKEVTIGLYELAKGIFTMDFAPLLLRLKTVIDTTKSLFAALASPAAFFTVTLAFVGYETFINYYSKAGEQAGYGFVNAFIEAVTSKTTQLLAYLGVMLLSFRSIINTQFTSILTLPVSLLGAAMGGITRIIASLAGGFAGEYVANVLLHRPELEGIGNLIGAIIGWRLGKTLATAIIESAMTPLKKGFIGLLIAGLTMAFAIFEGFVNTSKSWSENLSDVIVKLKEILGFQYESKDLTSGLSKQQKGLLANAGVSISYDLSQVNRELLTPKVREGLDSAVSKFADSIDDFRKTSIEGSREEIDKSIADLQDRNRIVEEWAKRATSESKFDIQKGIPKLKESLKIGELTNEQKAVYSFNSKTANQEIASRIGTNNLPSPDLYQVDVKLNDTSLTMVLDDINKSFERNTSAITAPFDESIRNALTTLNKATPDLINSVKEALPFANPEIKSQKYLDENIYKRSEAIKPLIAELNDLVIARNKYIWQMEDAAKSQQKFNKTISDAKAIGIKIDPNSFVMTDELAGKFDSLTASIKRLDQQAQETDNIEVRVNLKITAESLKQYGQALSDKNASADKSIRESIKGYSEELGFQLPKAFESLSKTDLEGSLAKVRDTKFKSTIGKLALPEIPEKPGLMSQLQGTEQYQKLQKEYNDILNIRKSIEEAGNVSPLDLEVTKYSELQNLMEKAKTNPLTAKLLTDEALLSNSINKVTSEYAGYAKEKIGSVGIELADINLQKQIYKDNGEKLAELNSRAERLVSSIKSVDLVPLKESFGVFISDLSDTEIQLILPEQAEILRQSALHIANLKEQLTALAKTPNSSNAQREIYKQIVEEEEKGRKAAIESSLARKSTITGGRLSAAADLMNHKYVDKKSLMTLFNMNAAVESLKEKIASEKNPALFVKFKNELISTEKNLERFKSSFDDITSKTSVVRDIFKTDIADKELAKLPNNITRGLIGAAKALKTELEDALSESGNEFSDKAKNIFIKLKEVEKVGAFITFFKDLANSVEESFTDGFDASLAKIKAGLPDLNISSYRLASMPDQGKGLAQEASNLAMFNKIKGMSDLSNSQIEIINSYDQSNLTEVLKKLADDFYSKGSDLNKLLQTPLENSIDATQTLNTTMQSLTTKVDDLINALVTKPEEAPAETTSLPQSDAAKNTTAILDRWKSLPKGSPVFEPNVEKWSDLVNNAIKEFPNVTADMVKTVIQHESQGRNIAAIVKPGVKDTSFGLGQFNNATASFLGIDKTNEADSLRGIAKYLSLNLKMFKNVPDAFRAYAVGQTGAKEGKGYDKQAEFMAIYEGRAGIKTGKPLPMAKEAKQAIKPEVFANVAQATKKLTDKYTSEVDKFAEERLTFGSDIRGALVRSGALDKDAAAKLGEEGVNYILGLTNRINAQTDRITQAAANNQPVEEYIRALNESLTIKTAYLEGATAKAALSVNPIKQAEEYNKGTGGNRQLFVSQYGKIGADVVAYFNEMELNQAKLMTDDLLDAENKLRMAKDQNQATAALQDKVDKLTQGLKDMGDAISESAKAASEAGKANAAGVSSGFSDAFKGVLSGDSSQGGGVFGTFKKKMFSSIADNAMTSITGGVAQGLGFGKGGRATKFLEAGGTGLFNLAKGGITRLGGLFGLGGTRDGTQPGQSYGVLQSDAGAVPTAQATDMSTSVTDSVKEGFMGIKWDELFKPLQNFLTGIGDALQALTSGGDINWAGLGSSFLGLFKSGSSGSSAGAGGYSGASYGMNIGGGGLQSTDYLSSSSFGFHATGGLISGPGTGTSDSIPAMLSNGEFVINAKSAGQHRDLLAAINDGRKVHKFAMGGSVGEVSAGVMAVPSAPLGKQLSTSTAAGKSTIVNLNITGDISRQTRNEVYRMMPSIASGVNTHNKEQNYKG